MAVHREVRLGSAELVPDIDRTDAWLLFIDGVPQSGVDLADPGYLEFEYVRRIGHAADLAFPARAPLRALHLGGGALTLPRYLAHTRPGSRQLVAELDDALTDLVRGHLPLPAGHRIRVRAADARAVAESVRVASYDLVIADVFAGAVTPGHLTTAEFAAATARALRPGGVYAVNVAAGLPLDGAATVAGGRGCHRPFCVQGDVRDRRGERAPRPSPRQPGDPRQRPAAARGGARPRGGGRPLPRARGGRRGPAALCRGAPVVTDATVTFSPASPEAAPQPTNW